MKREILWSLAFIGCSVSSRLLTAATEDPTGAVPIKLSATGYVPNGNSPGNLRGGISFTADLIWPTTVGLESRAHSGFWPADPGVITETMTTSAGDLRVVPGKSYQMIMGAGELQNASLGITAPQDTE